MLISAAYAVVGPAANAIGVEATPWLCAAIVFVSITAQLLSREVRDLPRLPPVTSAPDPAPAYAATADGS